MRVFINPWIHEHNVTLGLHRSRCMVNFVNVYFEINYRTDDIRS